MHNNRGPKCFVGLKSVDCWQCAAYNNICERLGLLENVRYSNGTSQEADTVLSPINIQHLFSTLIPSCRMSKPQYHLYKEERMAEDIFQQLSSHSDVGNMYNE